MSRYIDAEWIRNIYADFEHYENRDDWTTPITNVLAVIDDAPSIDIEPRRGEWIYTNDPLRLDDEWACSRCGNISFARTNFCDRCGARMKGADDE